MPPDCNRPKGGLGRDSATKKNGVIPQARTKAQSVVKSDLEKWGCEGRKTSVCREIEAGYPFKRDTPE